MPVRWRGIRAWVLKFAEAACQGPRNGFDYVGGQRARPRVLTEPRQMGSIPVQAVKSARIGGAAIESSSEATRRTSWITHTRGRSQRGTVLVCPNCAHTCVQHKQERGARSAANPAYLQSV